MGFIFLLCKTYVMRKTILLVLTIIITHSFVSAQKNTWLLYGNLSVISAKTSYGQKQTQFLFTPGIGYQFTNHWTVGVAPSIGTYKYNNGSSDQSNHSNDIKLGPFIRYTKELSDLISVYAQFGASYLFGKDVSFGNPDSKYSGFETSLYPAVLINLKKGLALNFSLGA